MAQSFSTRNCLGCKKPFLIRQDHCPHCGLPHHPLSSTAVLTTDMVKADSWAPFAITLFGIVFAGLFLRLNGYREKSPSQDTYKPARTPRAIQLGMSPEEVWNIVGYENGRRSWQSKDGPIILTFYGTDNEDQCALSTNNPCPPGSFEVIYTNYAVSNAMRLDTLDKPSLEEGGTKWW